MGLKSTITWPIKNLLENSLLTVSGSYAFEYELKRILRKYLVWLHRMYSFLECFLQDDAFIRNVCKEMIVDKILYAYF